MHERAPATFQIDVSLGRSVDLASSLRPFARSGDDGLDRWDGTTLLRTVRLDGAVIPYAARPAASSAANLTAALPAAAREQEDRARAAIRATFATDGAGVADLVRTDAGVAELVGRYPGVVPVLIRDPFTALVRSISAQQVNLGWAVTIRRRLAERYGVRHELDGHFVYSLHPAPLAAASVEDLRALQLTTAKSRAVIEVARAAQAGELEAADLARLPDEGLITHLTRLRGIGRWSAEWFLARTLGRPRVVAGDLGVRKAVGRMYRGGALPSEAEVRRLTEHWGVAATHIQALALHDLARSLGEDQAV